MRLRTKLLVGVGILLLALVALMYSLPTYFIRKDIYQASEKIHALLMEEHNELIRSQAVWLKNTLGRIKQNINSLLYLLYEEPTFSSKLVFSPSNSDLNVWNSAATLSGYDPSIGFIQIHSPEEKKSAVITPQWSQIYTIDKAVTKEKVALFSLRGTQDSDKIIEFVGIPLPQKFQTEAGYTLYALIDPTKRQEEQKVLEEEIKNIAPTGLSDSLLHAPEPIYRHEEEGNVYHWAIKIDLLRTLTPLFVEGLSVDENTTLVVPEGIARLDRTGNGYAILTQKLYHTEPLFNDIVFYEQHQPPPLSPPVANSNVIISDKSGQYLYLGTTLLVDKTYITVGVTLNNLLEQLALASNKAILVHLKEGNWLGFDEDGTQFTKERMDQIVAAGLKDQKRGVLQVGNDSFYYARIGSQDEGNLTFFDLRGTGQNESILSTLMSLEETLSSRISIQLSLIAILAMTLILIFVARIAIGVIRPVRQLAMATELVVAGRYGEVVLPSVGKRKDEVAILTHSFDAMVKGLQEREKIRGVLDKVVSKDVADEILRTQIHLGGEDRVVSMLFSDIRGFTRITENISPQLTIDILNQCMTKISRVIEGEGGVIDKYVGDEVMAIFGAPTTHPDHALRAVSTGLLMIETLKKWNEKRLQDGETLIEMGIGVHSGLVVAGNMGAEDRLNYTVLGANVNLASRLCDIAHPNQLIISEATLAQPNVGESFYVEALEPITLKGFSAPIQIYEVKGFKWEEV